MDYTSAFTIGTIPFWRNTVLEFNFSELEGDDLPAVKACHNAGAFLTAPKDLEMQAPLVVSTYTISGKQIGSNSSQVCYLIEHRAQIYFSFPIRCYKTLPMA